MEYRTEEGYLVMTDAARWAAKYLGNEGDKQVIGRRYNWIRDLVNKGVIESKPYGSGGLIKQVSIQSLKERLDYVPPFRRTTEPAAALDDSDPLDDVLNLLLKGILQKDAAKQAIIKIFRPAS